MQGCVFFVVRRIQRTKSAKIKKGINDQVYAFRGSVTGAERMFLKINADVYFKKCLRSMFLCKSASTCVWFYAYFLLYLDDFNSLVVMLPSQLRVSG